MPRVFISYVRENSRDVQRLADVLRLYGIEVWLDRDEIKPGYRWKDAIREAISQGDFFIACFSTEYSTRTKTYMNEELTLAIEELRLRPTDRAWFIPVLLSECDIPDRSIGAGETLRSIQWVELHRDWNAGMQSILAVIQPDSGKVYELMQVMKDKSARVRTRAADDLGRLGKLAQEAVPSLAQALQDRNEMVRAAAADALGDISDSSAVPPLIDLLCRRDPASDNARTALIRMGSDAVPALIEALGSEDTDVRAVVADVLRHIDDGAIVSVLIETVDSVENNIRIGVIDLLGVIGDPIAVPVLIEALGDEDDSVRADAAVALGKIGAPAAVPALIEALGDEDDSVRADAAVALGTIGAPAAVPALIEALGDEDDSVRAALVRALRAIGDPVAVPPLIEVLDDLNHEVRAAAVSALGGFGDPAAVPKLVEKALHDDYYELDGEGYEWKAVFPVRLVAVQALCDIGDESAVRGLIEALHNPTNDWATPMMHMTNASIEAWRALKRIGTSEALAAIEGIRREDLGMRGDW